jgi:hypothetical protein
MKEPFFCVMSPILDKIELVKKLKGKLWNKKFELDPSGGDLGLAN